MKLFLKEKYGDYKEEEWESEIARWYPQQGAGEMLDSGIYMLKAIENIANGVHAVWKKNVPLDVELIRAKIFMEIMKMVKKI